MFETNTCVVWCCFKNGYGKDMRSKEIDIHIQTMTTIAVSVIGGACSC